MPKAKRQPFPFPVHFAQRKVWKDQKIRVWIWRTKAEMNQAVHLQTGEPSPNGWAWCVGSAKPSIIADLHFVGSRMKGDVIGHEAQHATVMFAKRFELDFFDDEEDEEVLCEIAGTIVYLVLEESAKAAQLS